MEAFPCDEHLPDQRKDCPASAVPDDRKGHGTCSERIKIAQRPPFQMIEKVTELVPNESATGIKNVSVNEPYFMGHFPGTPIMPGVLICEACAQLCSLVIEKPAEDLEKNLYVLLKIDGFKFVKPVIPGDQLEISVNKTKGGGVIVGFDCVVKVNGNVHAKGSLRCSDETSFSNVIPAPEPEPSRNLQIEKYVCG